MVVNKQGTCGSAAGPVSLSVTFVAMSMTPRFSHNADTADTLCAVVGAQQASGTPQTRMSIGTTLSGRVLLRIARHQPSKLAPTQSPGLTSSVDGNRRCQPKRSNRITNERIRRDVLTRLVIEHLADEPRQATLLSEPRIKRLTAHVCSSPGKKPSKSFTPGRPGLCGMRQERLYALHPLRGTGC